MDKGQCLQDKKCAGFFIMNYIRASYPIHEHRSGGKWFLLASTCPCRFQVPQWYNSFAPAEAWTSVSIGSQKVVPGTRLHNNCVNGKIGNDKDFWYGPVRDEYR